MRSLVDYLGSINVVDSYCFNELLLKVKGVVSTFGSYYQSDFVKQVVPLLAQVLESREEIECVALCVLTYMGGDAFLSFLDACGIDGVNYKSNKYPVWAAFFDTKEKEVVRFVLDHYAVVGNEHVMQDGDLCADWFSKSMVGAYLSTINNDKLYLTGADSRFGVKGGFFLDKLHKNKTAFHMTVDAMLERAKGGVVNDVGLISKTLVFLMSVESGVSCGINASDFLEMTWLHQRDGGESYLNAVVVAAGDDLLVLPCVLDQGFDGLSVERKKEVFFLYLTNMVNNGYVQYSHHVLNYLINIVEKNNASWDGYDLGRLSSFYNEIADALYGNGRLKGKLIHKARVEKLLSYIESILLKSSGRTVLKSKRSVIKV